MGLSVHHRQGMGQQLWPIMAPLNRPCMAKNYMAYRIPPANGLLNKGTQMAI